MTSYWTRALFSFTKKKRISFKDHQKLKTDETELDKELKNFQSCCVRKCYTWLTMQLLLYCRRQYILQPDYNFRRKWLEDEYQRLETGRGCYCYSIDVLGSTGNNVVWKPEPLLCGIPMATHKRQRNPSTRNRKKKLNPKLRSNLFLWHLQLLCSLWFGWYNLQRKLATSCLLVIRLSK